eukprot:UN01061
MISILLISILAISSNGQDVLTVELTAGIGSSSCIIPLTLYPAADGSCNLPDGGIIDCVSRVECDCANGRLNFQFWAGNDLPGCDQGVEPEASGFIACDNNVCSAFPTCTATYYARWGQAGSSWENACNCPCGLTSNHNNTYKEDTFVD